MIVALYRPGTGELVDCLRQVLPVTVPGRSSKRIWRNDNPPQFAIAGRSAELCLHRGTRAKHFGMQQGQQNRNSGQRAASRCGTRNRFVAQQELFANTRRLPKKAGNMESVSSGGRAALAGLVGGSSPSRIAPRFKPFQPIRPGPNRRSLRANGLLRFFLAGMRQEV